MVYPFTVITKLKMYKAHCVPFENFDVFPKMKHRYF